MTVLPKSGDLRHKEKLDSLFRPNQNGFRTGLSTISPQLALRNLIDRVKSHN